MNTEEILIGEEFWIIGNDKEYDDLVNIFQSLLELAVKNYLNRKLSLRDAFSKLVRIY